MDYGKVEYGKAFDIGIYQDSFVGFIIHSDHASVCGMMTPIQALTAASVLVEKANLLLAQEAEAEVVES